MKIRVSSTITVETEMLSTEIRMDIERVAWLRLRNKLIEALAWQEAIKQGEPEITLELL